MRDERFNIREEAKLIPAWAIVLAVLAFIGMLALFLLVAFRHEPNPPPIPLQVFISFLPGSILALFLLLGGYVNRDTKRRGMNRALWTILVFIVPNGIGFILYFLLRQPLRTPCPQCGALATTSFNFCPKCKFNLHPACPVCHRAVRLGDTFCPYCAHDLAADAPAGGRAVTPLSPGATA